MDKDTPEVTVVFLKTVIQLTNMPLVEKAQDTLLELPAPFAWNNLDQSDPLGDRLLDNPIQVRINLVAAIIEIVQI
jgi:hypothetical protein